MFLPLIIFLPLSVIRREKIRAGGGALMLAGFLVAASTALYAEGLIRGVVARVILLFYLTPVWSTVFGRLMLNELITPRRLVTIVLGLAGMFVIFGVDSGGLPLPHNMGEWMGLISGVCWGLGVVYLRRTESVHPIDKTAVTYWFVGIIFLLFTLIPGGREWNLPSFSLSEISLLWLIALAFLWNIPIILLTAIGASKLDPGKVAVLLMLEIVIGLTSAAWLANEPFGMREFIGAILIISAGAMEFFSGIPQHRVETTAG